MPVGERTPLLPTDLPTDPPIDDDSYHYETQSLPSEQQHHFLYGAYALTVSFSRLFELSAVLSIALRFWTSAVPVTMLAITLIVVMANCTRLAAAIMATARSRFGLLVAAILVQRAAVVVFCSVLLVSAAWWAALVGIAAYAIHRLASAVFHNSFQLDWCRVITNDQATAYSALTSGLRAIGITTYIAFPVLSGVVNAWLGMANILRLFRVAAVLSAVVEIGLVWKLFNTCYALRLPRTLAQDLQTVDAGSNAMRSAVGIMSYNRPFAFGGTAADRVTPSSSEQPTTTSAAAARDTGARIKSVSWRRPPVKHLYRFVRSHPMTILVSTGLILVHTSIVVVGPQVIWFFGVNGISSAFMGLFRTLEVLAMLRPWSDNKWVAASALAAGSIIAATSISLGSPHALVFGFSIVASRLGILGFEATAQQLVEKLVADPDVHKVYHDAEATFQGVWTLCVQVLTLIWHTPENFHIAIIISSALTVLGVALVLSVSMRV